MSREQYLNRFSFQAIASVNFSDGASILAALKYLKESGAFTVLLIMQQQNAYKLMKMVLLNTFHTWILCKAAWRPLVEPNFLLEGSCYHWVEIIHGGNYIQLYCDNNSNKNNNSTGLKHFNVKAVINVCPSKLCSVPLHFTVCTIVLLLCKENIVAKEKLV